MGNISEDIITIILGAGLGKRMKSGLTKVLHPVAGLPMIMYPVKAAGELSSLKTVVVVGHQADRVKEALSGKDVEIVHQAEQKGTADAVSLAMESIRDFTGLIVVLCGDVPLITSERIAGLIEAHKKAGASITVLTTEVDDPSGYGRIFRGADGSVMKIVEDRDADENIKGIREINTGIYVFNGGFLSKIISNIGSANAQKEFYLTDSVEIGIRKGLKVVAHKTIHREDVMGINTRVELAIAERIMSSRINKRHMLNGVTFVNPETVYIEDKVVIGRDVTIYPGTVIQGNTVIGEGSIIYSNSRIKNSRIGCGVTIKDACVIDESKVGDNAQIGPFAHLRPGNVLEKNVRIGNYVELKKAVMGEGSKANHLTYLGDAEIGSGVNIGAGTITCNYDGYKKYKTTIGNDVFVGSDVQFIAPVNIGDSALIAAGSTVTKDVPPGALAISRVEQENREGYVEKRRKIKSDE